MVAVPHFLIILGIAPVISEVASSYAVEIFFVLSGFVLAPQLSYCYERNKGEIYLRFLCRRWMRTLPPYLVALILFTGAFGSFFSDQFFLYLSFLQNVFNHALEGDYFSISWSLAVEEWFYLLFPLTLALVAAVAHPSFMSIAIGFMLVFLIARTLLGDFDDWGAGVRRVVVFRLDSIAFGVVLYQWLQPLRRASLRWRGLLLIAAVAACTVLSWQLIETDATWSKHLFFLSASALGATLILFAMAAEPWLRRSRFLSDLAVFFGRISYTTYLFHLLVLQAAGAWLHGLPIIVALPVYLGLIVVVTAVFYEFVERPILASRPRLQPREAAESLEMTVRP